MAIRSDARLGGSIPQHNRVPEGVGIRPLFHSVRDIALILDKTVKAGYGVIKSGTIMAVCSATGNLVPYAQTNADENDTNAKSYLVASPGSGAIVCNIGIEDSYKFVVGDSLVMDGSGTGTDAVQSIVCATPWATASVYVLTFGSHTITATMGATQTLAGLVTLIQAATGYASLPFAVTAGTNALTLTWKVSGPITEMAQYVKDGGSAVVATTTTPGVEYDMDALSAEDLGAITAIDRTAVNSTQAQITFTTSITNYANFTTEYYGNVYVKGGDSSTPFTKAACIIDADVDSGIGEFAVGALTSIVISNAVLYTASLIGLDAAAIVDLGSVDDGRFTILK